MSALDALGREIEQLNRDFTRLFNSDPESIERDIAITSFANTVRYALSAIHDHLCEQAEARPPIRPGDAQGEDDD